MSHPPFKGWPKLVDFINSLPSLEERFKSPPLDGQAPVSPEYVPADGETHPDHPLASTVPPPVTEDNDCLMREKILAYIHFYYEEYKVYPTQASIASGIGQATRPGPVARWLEQLATARVIFRKPNTGRWYLHGTSGSDGREVS